MTDLDLFFDSSRDVAMALSLILKNLHFSQANLLCCAAFPKRIGILQFQFQKIKWNEFMYIV